MFNEAKCPLCDTDVRVKAFKVCDEDGKWWSRCHGDHSAFQSTLAERVPEAVMYFSWMNEDHALLESVKGHVVHVEWRRRN